MDLKMDKDGKVVFENNTIPTVTGADEVRQRILQRLRAVTGEWFLDRTDGIPWFTKVFEKTGENPQAILVRAITDTPGVKQILSFTYEEDKSSRKLNVDARVLTTNDEKIKVEDTYE